MPESRPLGRGILLMFVLLGFPLLIAQGQTPSGIGPQQQAAVELDLQQAAQLEAAKDFNQAAFHLGRAATTLWTHGELRRAIELFERAIALNERIGNRHAIHVLSTNIGMIRSSLQEHQLALAAFARATQVARAMGREQQVAEGLLAQANALKGLGRHAETLPLLREAEGMAKERNNSRLLRNVYSLLSQAYDAMGQREQAAHYFDLFASLTRRLQHEEMQRKELEAQEMVTHAQTRVTQAEAQRVATERVLTEKELELEQKQQVLEEAEREAQHRLMQVELLSKEAQLQESIIRQQNLMRNVFIIIITAILIVFGLVYYGYQQKKRANSQLVIKNQEISRQNVEIQAQAEQLRDLNQLKDKLFSIISHDLRSPLGSLVALLNLTKEGYFTEQGFKEIVNELSTNVGYTTNLLENLLKWAQSQLQGTRISPTGFNLFQVVADRAPLFSEPLARKGIRLDNNVDPAIAVYADRDMIELVIRNLVSNAIKFSSKGDRIEVSARQEGPMVQVCVADTGQGIAPMNLENLFGRKIFTTPGTSDEKGTGLGLILCKDFVTLNGGRIWAESVQGEGAQFYFTLPAA